MRVAFDSPFLSVALALATDVPVPEQVAAIELVAIDGLELLAPAPAVGELLASARTPQHIRTYESELVRGGFRTFALSRIGAHHVGRIGQQRDRKREIRKTKQALKWDAAIVGTAAEARARYLVTVDADQVAMARELGFIAGAPSEIARRIRRDWRR